jgi:hypothetical protein
MIVVAIGIYLFLGIMNLLVITPSINLFFIEIKPLSIFFQPLSLGLFVLYFLLNNDTLLNMYLDYRENKSK